MSKEKGHKTDLQNEAVPQHSYGGAGGEDEYLLFIYDFGNRW
jgi:hypothetical protein